MTAVVQLSPELAKKYTLMVISAGLPTSRHFAQNFGCPFREDGCREAHGGGDANIDGIHRLSPGGNGCDHCFSNPNRINL
jgi:hypothetical protein